MIILIVVLTRSSPFLKLVACGWRLCNGRCRCAVRAVFFSTSNAAAELKPLRVTVDRRELQQQVEREILDHVPPSFNDSGSVKVSELWAY